MAIALTLQEFLDWEEIDYTVVKHPPTHSSLGTAHAAHIEPEKLAKTVVLCDEKGFVLVVVPASQQVDLERLRKIYNREFYFANEREIEDLFYDCEQGAIPALGEAYGFEVLLDENLEHCPDIYIEGGDHCALIHMQNKDFKQLMANAEHGYFGH